MKALALIFAVGVAAKAFADSPLTSISFADAYPDSGVPKPFDFLISSASNDQKLAVANALGWGKDNAEQFAERVDAVRKGDQTAADYFVAGYLAAMDDYLELKRGPWNQTPQQLIDRAAKALPDDFSVQYARALIRAQAVMDKSWCDVYKIPQAVLEKFPPAKRNLRPKAVAAAEDYLKGYAEECPGSAAAQLKHKDELNQVYTIARLGRQLVLGTQGGIVVWEPEKNANAPIAVHDGFICNTLTLGAYVWGGCESEVVRWDGHGFKTFLPRSAKGTSEYYRPLAGANGATWAWLGSKLWAYDAATEHFSPLAQPWKSTAYDVLVRKNGEVWWVEFLKSLRAGERTIALKSAAYPGRDPRALTEDETGTVWVQDFESGLFRQTADGTFVKEPGLDSRASGVAIDDLHGETYLLHYTDGLVVKGRDGVHTIDLRELEFMRDLERDPSTGDLWVAGWNGFARLHRDGMGWAKTIFRAK